jgi:hypothetical protein
MDAARRISPVGCARHCCAAATRCSLYASARLNSIAIGRLPLQTKRRSRATRLRGGSASAAHSAAPAMPHSRTNHLYGANDLTTSNCSSIVADTAVVVSQVLETYVTNPGRRSSKPFSAAIWNALRAVVRDTPSIAIRWRSGGKTWSLRHRFSRIRRPRFRVICKYFGVSSSDDGLSRSTSLLTSTVHENNVEGSNF